jgi:hypothetical protein
MSIKSTDLKAVSKPGTLPAIAWSYSQGPHGSITAMGTKVASNFHQSFRLI